MIEPDYENLDILLENMNVDMNNFNISVLPFALGEKNQKKKFYYNIDYCSQFSSISNKYIRVKKLDDLNVKPTFIKIHTEGNENNIIKGGLKTIKKYRPIIVTT